MKLAIELDGSVHDDAMVRSHGSYRELRLRRHGITILRIRTEEVVANPRLVEGQIRREIQDLRRFAGRYEVRE